MITYTNIIKLVNPYLKNVAVMKLCWRSIFLENTVLLPNENAASIANIAAMNVLSFRESNGNEKPKVRK